MLYDLHVHSTASDGTSSPEELIKEAMLRGLPGIAITDHDTIDGLQIAIDYIRNNNIPFDFVPGVEMNTEYGGNEVHILGYYIDFNNSILNERLFEIRGQRQQRARNMVIQLNKLGIKINFEDVVSLAGSDLIARPHVAMAMINAGYVDNIQEAFNKYIGKGKPAYVNRYKFTPDEAIKLIKGAGGIAVLAHPGLIKDQQLLSIIIKMGIAGLEVFYPEHNVEQINMFSKLALNNHLLITGGSDYHGFNQKESRSSLGAAGIDIELMSRIKALKKV